MIRGKLIVLEGIDGCGKSTQCKMLHEALEKTGLSVKLTAEPQNRGSQYADTLRRISKLSMPPVGVQAGLFVLDRWLHTMQVVEPALSAGIHVVQSRSYLSSVAYQGAQGLDPSTVAKMSEFAPAPDLVIWLDLSPKEAMERVGEADGFERLGLAKKVRQAYTDIYMGAVEGVRVGRMYRLGVSGLTPETVHEEVLRVALSVLGDAT